ncbi:hypothetical protein HPB47_027773, partial [Ixodes persulcatus]
MYPFKAQLLHERMPGDYSRRVQFCEDELVKIQANPSHLQFLLFTNVSVIPLDDCVNKQSYRFWTGTNPCWSTEHAVQSRKVVLWMGPFPLFNPPESLAKPLKFPGRWMGRGSPNIAWPPRSQHLTTCELVLVWEHAKAQVHARRSRTVLELKEHTYDAFETISDEMREAVFQDYDKRLERSHAVEMPSYGSYCCVAWCGNNGRTCKKPGTKFFRFHGTAAISRASTPSFRKSAVRTKDVIKRLQAKVSRYRKAITRLRKQEQKAPQTATEALDMICPHVTEEVFQLGSSHVKLRSKGRRKRFPLWLKDDLRYYVIHHRNPDTPEDVENLADRLGLMNNTMNSGIGEGVCRALAEEGAQVIVASTGLERATEVAQSLPGNQGHQAFFVDVSNADSVAALFENIRKSSPIPLSIVVNSAGIFKKGDLVDFKPEDFDAVINVNVR